MHDASHALATDPIDRAFARAREVLPDQGPIGVFIHHNTLHAVQHLPFHEGVQAGAAALGARPYLSLWEFRAHYERGRISDQAVRVDIAATLGSQADAHVLPGLTRAALWYTLLTTPCDVTDMAAHAYTVAQDTAPECADAARWTACVARTASAPRVPTADTRRIRRHRDVLVVCEATDTDIAVHGELIRLASGFLDQGQAHTVAPFRHLGFLRAVSAMYDTGAPPPRACPGVDADFRAVYAAQEPADAVIRRVLTTLGVTENEIEPWLFATALALPGWSGMFSRLERHPEEHHDNSVVLLTEFIAVRLLLEQRAIAESCRVADLPVSWPALRAAVPALPTRSAHADAVLLWWISQAAGITPDAVLALTEDALRMLWREVADCDDLTRRRVMQDAYERTYREQILDAVAARRQLPAETDSARPRAQFVFCIDEREESIRRALEEQHPGYITFGMAGFFGVAIDYQGLDDHEPAAYCPVVVTPGHEVHEQPVYTALGRHQLRQRLRHHWLRWERRAATASKTLLGGAGMSFLLGPVSGLKTVARVLAPRTSLRMSEQMVSQLAPVPVTRLSTFRVDDASRMTDGRKPMGFSLAESVERVTNVLTNLGITQHFAPVIIMLGHGSTSLNNPHESAHDCGACGGRRGGANARLFADMANRPDVRDGVRQRGITIPADTWFVGALHDTANDSVRYYDLEALPPALAPAFDEAYEALEKARRENAAERSRRFDDAPLGLAPDDALRHVEARSSHLAQPRPEYGHCTNATCFVGRRALTRGLHLDRRAFLVSYDPAVDHDDRVLERILAAVGPVGAGISLEYYFSSVDNEAFGCGTKLPHNVTGLLGVMNGHQSDLRTGLPLQMVELHEPMRLLLIVDASPDALLRVAGRQAEVAELVVKEWVQLVACDPESGTLSVFTRGGFVPYTPHPTLLPVVEHSPAWHGASRDYVTPALVRRALPEAVVGPGHHPAAA